MKLRNVEAEPLSQLRRIRQKSMGNCNEHSSYDGSWNQKVVLHAFAGRTASGAMTFFE